MSRRQKYYKKLYGARAPEEMKGLEGLVKNAELNKQRQTGLLSIKKEHGMYTFHNFLYNRGLCVVDWVGGLLRGPLNDQLLLEPKDWENHFNHTSFRSPSAPMYAAMITALFDNRIVLQDEQYELINDFAKRFKSDLFFHGFLTNTKVRYAPMGGLFGATRRDTIIHDSRTRHARKCKRNIAAPPSDVDSGQELDYLLRSLLEVTDVPKFKEALDWLRGKSDIEVKLMKRTKRKQDTYVRLRFEEKLYISTTATLQSYSMGARIR